MLVNLFVKLYKLNSLTTNYQQMAAATSIILPIALVTDYV